MPTSTWKANTMRRIPLNLIPNTITREAKKTLANVTVADPATLVFALDGEDGTASWTQDERENLSVYPDLVCSLLLKHHNTANKCTTEEKGFWYRSDKGDIDGNLLVWGSLSRVNVTIMGTVEEPMLVVSDTGRQQCKAAEWLTGFLAVCREALKAHKGDTFKAQHQVLGDHANDPIVRSFAPVHWAVIFQGGSSTGRPLVSWNDKAGKYSAVFWVSLTAGGGAPSERATLERAKLARIQVPSTVSGEALTLRKLVLSYLREAANTTTPHTEETALRHAGSFVSQPMTVGASNRELKEAWTQSLYKFSLVCAAVREKVDAEADPRKMLALFDRAVKKCVKIVPQNEAVGDEFNFTYSGNALTEEQQLTAFLPKPKKAKETKKVPVTTPEGTMDIASTVNSATGDAVIVWDNLAPSSVSPSRKVAIRVQLDTVRRLSQAARSPMSPLGSEDKAAAAAIVKYLAWEAGDSTALPESLRKLLTIEEDEDDSFADLKDFIEHWDGKAPLTHDNEAVQSKLDELRKTLADVRKPDDRALAAQDWLLKQVTGV